MGGEGDKGASLEVGCDEDWVEEEAEGDAGEIGAVGGGEVVEAVDEGGDAGWEWGAALSAVKG